MGWQVRAVNGFFLDLYDRYRRSIWIGYIQFVLAEGRADFCVLRCREL